MKKQVFTKLLLVVLTASVVVCGCGEKDESRKVRKRNNTNTSSTEVSNTSTSEPNTGANGNEGEIDNPYFEEMDSVVISYYFGHTYSNMDYLNSSGELSSKPITITLSDDKIEKLEEAYKKYTRYIPETDEIPVTEYCRVILNDDKELYFSTSEQGFFYQKESNSYFVDEDFSDIIYSAIEHYENESLKSDMFARKISSCNDNITAKQCEIELVNFPELAVIKYAEFNIDGDPNTSIGNVSYVFMFEDGSILMLYEDSSDAFYIPNDGNNEEGIFITFDMIDNMNIDTYIRNKIDNTNRGIAGQDMPAEIVISHDGKEEKITDSDKIEEIISMVEKCEYDQYSWLTSDYDMGDCIEVDMGHGKYYFPVDESDGNQYYRDSNGELSLVWGFDAEILSELKSKVN